MLTPPSTSDDQALEYALRNLRFYQRARKRARVHHQAGEITILLTTAGTVVVAALHAPAVITASLAGVSLFLTGFRQVFGPDENWVRFTQAWARIDRTVARYLLVPADERDEERKRELLEEILAITEAESGEWARDRRRRSASAKSD